MQEIRAEEGWFVLHVFYRIDRPRWHQLEAARRKEVLERLEQRLEQFRKGENCQANCYSIIGHKADWGIMLVDPEFHHLSQMENDLLEVFPPGVLHPAYSYFSLTEVSEYMSSDSDYDRTLREKEGLSKDSPEYQQKMQAFRDRMSFYINDRLYPKLPEHRVMCFYPMSKSRGESKNWYALDFDTRKRLMGGHLISGRRYQGKVKQLVTGSVGLDVWEWAVTLFSDDPMYLKQIVYEMRFDEVSAVYGEFGDFLVGIRQEPAALFERLRLG